MSNKSTLPWGMIAGIAFAMALGMYFTFALFRAITDCSAAPKF